MCLKKSNATFQAKTDYLRQQHAKKFHRYLVNLASCGIKSMVHKQVVITPRELLPEDQSKMQNLHCEI